MDSSELAELYRDSAFAKRLAAELVGGEASQDVWQEAWRSILDHAPRPDQNLRERLLNLVRRKALHHRRGELRRRRREHLVAREEHLPSTAELVERAEVHRSVVDALLELDEPYKRTILLLFFEDLDSHEIARRDGIPLETVRTRRKRALAELREKLQRKHGESPAWLAGLGGLAGISQVPLVPRRFAPLALGAAAVLVASLLVPRWLTRYVEAPLLGRAAEPAEGVGLAGVTSPASARTPVETDSVRTLQAAPGSRPMLALVGDVVDELGAPVPEAEIRMKISGLFSSEPTVSARADAAGRYALRIPAPSSLELRSRSPFVQAWASGFRVTTVEILMGEAALEIERDLVLAPGDAFEGLVRDERGAPVEAAIVLAHFVSPDLQEGQELSETDDRGSYLIGVPAGTRLTEIESWTPRTGSGFLAEAELPDAPGSRLRDLVLLERNVLRGRTLHADGTPASDVQVMALLVVEDQDGRFFAAPQATVSAGGPTSCIAVSDADGGFAFHGLGPGPYALSARRAPRADPEAGIARETVVRGDAQDARVVVDSRRVMLEVVGPSDEPLADVPVSCTVLAPDPRGGWEPATASVHSMTGARGRVGFSSTPSSAVALTAHVPDWAGEVVLEIPELPFEIVERMEVDLPRGALRLRAEDGAPLLAAEVRLATSAGRIPLEKVWQSGPDGLVRDLPIGTFRVDVRSGEAGPWSLPIELSLAISSDQTTDVDVIRRNGGLLIVRFEPSGEARTDEQQEGLEHARALPDFPSMARILMPESQQAWLWSAEDPPEAPPFLVLDGARVGEAWESPRPLPGGRYRLEARFDGYHPVQEWISIEPEVKRDVLIPLFGRAESDR